MITAKLVSAADLLELQVLNVERISLNAGAKDEPSKIKINDMIRRKPSSIELGACQKLKG